MKVCTIIGARPQFIKAAVVSRAFSKCADVKEIIVHTGQHYDPNMSDIFFDELKIPTPDYHLGIGGGSHGQNTGRMIESIETVLVNEQPDFVLVYGDTDSTLAGSLAAVKLHIPVAHVEAGLRSFNRKMPEEINRILTDHASDLLFVPTDQAVENLHKEGLSGARVKIIGDVMMDAAVFYADIAVQKSTIMKDLSLTARDYVLATLHRAENTGDRKRIEGILSGFSEYGGDIILPVHPRTKKIISDMGVLLPRNVRFIDPVGYLDMIVLEKNARMIATDSGGVQKEAYFHSIPCVTLRDETEWVELVEAGANLIAGADPEKIAYALLRDVGDIRISEKPLYGDARAGERIVSYLLGFESAESR